MASAPGFLYYCPWESWGDLKYMCYAPLVASAWKEGVVDGKPIAGNVYLHMLALLCLRYLLFQAWGTASRMPCVSRRYQIQGKGMKFEQIDHEANWESMLLVAAVALWVLSFWMLPSEGLPLWDWKGIAIAFLMHVGPIEWLYYWGHRALHHHSLFVRYHQHHHASFVTQPITANNHPFLEHLFYASLFGLPLGVALQLGHASIGLFYVYVIFIDFMNAWGHCNFEFIPTWVFDALPPLKYIVYSPTYHSLHHSRVHTNFCLFMPLYDYIYGTVDASTDSLYRDVRQGHATKVDCVYLTHATEVLSMFHLQFGFQTFAAQPYSKKWYMWLMWPVSVPLMVLAWLFAEPFVAATHLIGNNVELQTWAIPRFNFQYFLRSEAAGINGWIQECIMQAQKAGAKAIALALLNKDQNLDKDFVNRKDLKIAIVNGDTLSAAIVAKEVEAKHKNPAAEVFITAAHSRVGRAISAYLCERGYSVLAHVPSKDEDDNLRACISKEFQTNLATTTKYTDGKRSRVWILGEPTGREFQMLAPNGAYFHQHGVFPVRKYRKDCEYGGVPSMRLPQCAENINACEDCMPRNVVRASYVAAVVHALEGWGHNDLDEDISTDLMEKSWDSALKHGFSIANEEQRIGMKNYTSGMPSSSGL